MKTFLTLMLLALTFTAPAHAEEIRNLNGGYLKKSCTVFNKADANELVMNGTEDGYDKGIDAGFCSGFLLALLNSNYARSQANDANRQADFCPPLNLPVLEASKLLVRELEKLSKEERIKERGLDLTLKIFATAYPCGEAKPAQ
jgi:hypothetical protein